MELKQVVYVVIDHKEEKVLGAFNDEDYAKQVASEAELPTYVGNEISITPVLVDSVNWDTMSRKFWLTEEQVANAVKEEMELAVPCYEYDDEDDDGCDGECDVCCDFDCPSNASMFAPRDDDEEYEEEEEEDDDEEESFNTMLGIFGWMMSSDDEDDGQ